MMRIKVSATFSGELTLPTVGHPMTKNSTRSIEDKDAHADDIRMAVKKGWIEFVEGAPELDIHPTEFKVKNIGKKTLVIKNIIFEKDDMRFLTQDQINDGDVQKAIEMGLLEIESSEDPSDKIIGVNKKEPKKTEESLKEPYRPEESKTTMQAWDAHQEATLSKEELSKSSTKHVKQIKVAEADAVEEPKTRKKRKKKTTKKIGNKKGKKPRSLQPVGRVRPEPTADEIDPAFIDMGQRSEKIDFVNIEQEAERINSHPQLRKRSNQQVNLEMDD